MDLAFAQALCTPLASPRLRLQPLTGAHADAAFIPMQDERLYAWISMAKPHSLESLRADWTRIESRRSPSAAQAWPSWMVLLSDSGVAIGEVDAAVDEHLVCLNLGYYFFPGFWGRGYASEAVKTVVNHLRGYGIGRMVATVTAGNLASAQVLKKCGFVFSQLIADNDTLRGESVDDEEYIYSA